MAFIDAEMIQHCLVIGGGILDRENPVIGAGAMAAAIRRDTAIAVLQRGDLVNIEGIIGAERMDEQNRRTGALIDIEDRFSVGFNRRQGT